MPPVVVAVALGAALRLLLHVRSRKRHVEEDEHVQDRSTDGAMGKGNVDLGSALRKLTASLKYQRDDVNPVLLSPVEVMVSTALMSMSSIVYL